MQNLTSCDPVNIGYGAGITIRRALEIILDAAEHAPEVRFDASRSTPMPVRLVDTGKARRLLGFAPRIAIEDGLRDLVRWYAAHRATQ
jgi:nucleoside-diphosphate-sugar epimerase